VDRTSRSALALSLVFTFAAAAVAAALVFFVVPAGRRFRDDGSSPDQVAFRAARYSEIDGWPADDPSGALAAFVASCARLTQRDDAAPANPLESLGPDLAGASVSGVVADWRGSCADAVEQASAPRAGDRAETARKFFEAHFTPFRVLSRPNADRSFGPAPRASRIGRITGYFEPMYPASRFVTPERSAAALARPADLVNVELGDFRADLAGERIGGYVEDGRLMPYPDHQAINAGALGDRAEALAWLDPDDLFFLQIQGSGRLRFEDGTEMRVGYDGANGRPYTPIGRILVERGALAREDVSMQTIRAWLDRAPPAKAAALREKNESYVFFRPADPDSGDGPLGSGGAALSPMRSIAVDRRYYAFGTPIWLDVAAVEGRSPAIAQLFIAQDSGGAIRGPIRADIFAGAGDEAGELAGRLNAQGEMIVLLPNAVARRFASHQGER